MFFILCENIYFLAFFLNVLYNIFEEDSIIETYRLILIKKNLSVVMFGLVFWTGR